MNLILHIFRKDTRHLYPEILLALVFTVAFAWVAPVQWLYGQFGGIVASSGVASVLAPLLRVFLPIIWLVLITRVVQDESLVGDRQFWVTRPYTWPVLLAAKVLFLLVFLYLPLIAMQLYLLHHAGLNVRAALPDLLLYQLRLTVIYFLPVFAIATVTTTFARQFVTILAGLAYLGLLATADSQIMGQRTALPAIGMIVFVLSALMLGAVVLLQYGRRRTQVSRFVLAGLPVLLLVVDAGSRARGLIERAYPTTADGSDSAIGFDANPARQQPGSGAPYINAGDVRLSLPVKLQGLAAGTRLKAAGVSIHVVTSDGFEWTSPYENMGVDLRVANPTNVVDVPMPLDVFNRIRNIPVSLNVFLAVERTQAAATQTFAVEEPGFSTSGLGICPVRADGFMGNCLYALHLPPPIDVSAQVSNKPCMETAGSTRSVAQTFLGSDQNGVAYDFDPVATSRLQFQVITYRHIPGPNGSSASSGVGIAGFLCPGAPVMLTPHVLMGRERWSFRQSNLILAPYMRHMGPSTDAPAIVDQEQQ